MAGKELIFDKHGNIIHISGYKAKNVIESMLARSRNPTNPDYEMFTEIERRALFYFLGRRTFDVTEDEIDGRT